MTAKTYVLLHGAWHGGWCWKKITPLLIAAGHKVIAPTQTGLGERSHLLSPSVNLCTFVQDLLNVFEWEDLHNVILVGHSFGGNVITFAADRIPNRIKHLVYLDAAIPISGQSVFSQMPAELVQERRKLAQQTSDGLTIPVPSADTFGVLDETDAAWLKQKCTPHPIATYDDALCLEYAPGNGIPTTYIAVTPHYEPTASSRNYARKRTDWTYIEMVAGHDAMITSPDVLTEILLSIR